MPTMKVNGIELYYDEYGIGDNIVISASGGDFKHYSEGNWPYYLADNGYHLYTITLRGYWKSTHVTEDYGLDWYNIWADDVYEFGKNLGTDKYFYTGLSHGSGVGWHLADRRPEALKGFIAIVCGPHSLKSDLNARGTSPAREQTILAADDPELKLRIINEREPDWSKIPFDQIKKEKFVYEQWKQDFIEMTPEEMRIRPYTAFAWIKTEEEMEAKLRSISVPTLMIGGMQDTIISPESMLRSANCVPNSKTVLYQNGTHMVAYELVESVKQDILQFMRECDAHKTIPAADIQINLRN